MNTPLLRDPENRLNTVRSQDAARVFVITGASGVLGQALVQALTREGRRMALIDRLNLNPQVYDDAVLLLGGIDLTEPRPTQIAVDQVIKRFGRLDVLLNVAGGFQWSRFQDSGPELWTRLHTVNVDTAVNASRAALPYLLASPSGRIVNIGAGAAIRALEGMAPYAAAKAGVHRLTESLADEFRTSAMTVNAVLPSIIDTAANRADMPDQDPGAWVKPSELATAILFLASEAASGVNGALMPCPGRL